MRSWKSIKKPRKQKSKKLIKNLLSNGTPIKIQITENKLSRNFEKYRRPMKTSQTQIKEECMTCMASVDPKETQCIISIFKKQMISSPSFLAIMNSMTTPSLQVSKACSEEKEKMEIVEEECLEEWEDSPPCSIKTLSLKIWEWVVLEMGPEVLALAPFLAAPHQEALTLECPNQSVPQQKQCTFIFR